MTWTVELAMNVGQSLTVDEFETLDIEGDPRDWYIRPGAGYDVHVTVYTDFGEAEKAVHEACDQVGGWLSGHGLAPVFVGLRVRTEEDYARDAERATLPPLVAATDAAELLGVSRQRVHQLARDNPRFPEPVLTLGTGPVWTEDAILNFDRNWERKNGRPARVS